jgi:cytochrome P450
VICHLLGVPAADQERFRAWGHDVAATLEPQTARAARNSPQEAQLALTGYLRDLVDKRRSAPDASLLSALIAVEEEGDRLTTAELVSTALLLLVAGFETTVNLIGNAVVALDAHPDQLELLRAEPDRWGNAVEEVLRYDSPVQLTMRSAYQGVTVAGETVPAGQAVLVLLGGANRDPAVFTDPATFDVTRANAGEHLAFSAGIHFCLGASLARLEATTGLRALYDRFPGLTVTGRPVRRSTRVLRGFARVPATAMIRPVT